MNEGKKVVLIVDDSQSLRAQLRVMLEKLGFDVRSTFNEDSMNENIEIDGIRADVILMDLMLGDANGLDLVLKLNNNDNYKDIPIIVLTEHAKMDYINRAKDLKVNEYLLKPVNISKLKERLDRTLKK